MATYEELRRRVLYAAGDTSAARGRVGVAGPRVPEVARDELISRFRSGLLTYPTASGGPMSGTQGVALTPAVRVFSFPHCTTILSGNYLVALSIWNEARAALEYYLGNEPPLDAPWREQADWVVNVFYWCQLAIVSTSINWALVVNRPGEPYAFRDLTPRRVLSPFLEQVRDAAARHYGVTLEAYSEADASQSARRKKKLWISGALGIGTHGNISNSPPHAFEVCKRLFTDLDLTPWAYDSHWQSRTEVYEARSGLGDADYSPFGRPSITPTEFPMIVAMQVDGDARTSYSAWARALHALGTTFSWRDNIRTVFMTFADRSKVSEADANAVVLGYLKPEQLRTHPLYGGMPNADAPVVTVSTPRGLREQAKLYARAVLAVDLGRELKMGLTAYTNEHLMEFAVRGQLDIPPEQLSAAANALSRAEFSNVSNVVGAIGSTLSAALPPAAFVTAIVAGLYSIWGGLFSSGIVNVPQPFFLRRVPSCEQWAREAAAAAAVPIPLVDTQVIVPPAHDPNEGAGMSTGNKVALAALGAAGAFLLFKVLTR